MKVTLAVLALVVIGLIIAGVVLQNSPETKSKLYNYFGTSTPSVTPTSTPTDKPGNTVEETIKWVMSKPGKALLGIFVIGVVLLLLWAVYAKAYGGPMARHQGRMLRGSRNQIVKDMRAAGASEKDIFDTLSSSPAFVTDRMRAAGHSEKEIFDHLAFK